MIVRGADTFINAQGQELVDHGTHFFPLGCYEEDVSAAPVHWHWHDDWEFVLATKGTIQILTASDDILLQPGEAVCLGSGCVHEIKGEGQGSMLRSAVFHPRFLSSMDSVIWEKYVRPLQNVGVVVLVDSVSWQRACIQNFCACWDALDREPLGFEIQAREALIQLALLLYTHLDVGRQIPSLREQRNSQRIKVMLGFIQGHYAESLTTAQIAASAMLSESECLRCFHTSINMTPGQYLKEYRLRVAAGLLANTSEKAGDIGAACGFLDAAYFTKIFREQMGCTPGEYRKAHQEGRGSQK